MAMEFHVLVVDDSSVDRMLAERMVKKVFACKVTAVDSANKALEFLGLLIEEQKTADSDELKKVGRGDEAMDVLKFGEEQKSADSDLRGLKKVDSVEKPLDVLKLGKEGETTHFDPLKKVDVNLIISDYDMPGMTGFELLKKIKDSSSALRGIPVVIMSSYFDEARVASCLEAGAMEFVQKPVKPIDLQRLKQSFPGSS